MKKFLVSLLLIIVCNLAVYAENGYEDSSNYNMKTFWEKNGRYEEKVLKVGYNILNKNNITKNIAIVFKRNSSRINSFAYFFDKRVVIEKGVLPYIDSDDELAALLSHEIAHSLDMHHSYGRQLAMSFAPVRYETKADLTAIHLMKKAGYNPLAMITMFKKISGEHYDFGSTHPRGSSRITYIYNHIKTHYPEYINSNEYKKNPFYINALKIIKNNKSKPFGFTTLDIEDVVLSEKNLREKKNINL